MSFLQSFLFAALLLAFAEAFAPVAQHQTPFVTLATPSSATTTSLSALPLDTLASSSVQLSAETLDPTTVLSDVLGAFIGTPLILAVPILAALGIASLVAYAIVSYASPAADDDDEE